jgi:hypothetical protein
MRVSISITVSHDRAAGYEVGMGELTVYTYDDVADYTLKNFIVQSLPELLDAAIGKYETKNYERIRDSKSPKPIDEVSKG